VFSSAPRMTPVIRSLIRALLAGALLLGPFAGYRRAAVEARPAAARVIRTARPAVVRVRATGPMAQEAGTGFLVAGQGGGSDGTQQVITNHHVIWGASSISIELSGGAVIQADVVGSDAATDLALLRPRAPLRGMQPLSLGDDRSVQVGDQVVAIGNPGGIAGAASVGIVSARGKVPRPTVAAQAFVEYLFTDTLVAAGSSGGPVLSLDGRVIGVEVALAGQSGGLAIVIPARLVAAVVAGLERAGTARHAWSGLRVAGEPDGPIRVTSCARGCDAYAVKVGDEISSVDGERIPDARELEWRAFISQPGTRWNLDVVRGGRRMPASVELRPITQEDFVAAGD